jgi:hypothetical protein
LHSPDRTETHAHVEKGQSGRSIPVRLQTIPPGQIARAVRASRGGCGHTRYPLNRRISLIVQYQEKPAGGAEENVAGASGEKSAQHLAKQEFTGGGEPAAPKKE